MKERLLNLPLELYLGLIGGISGAILKDDTLLIMSIVFLVTSKILLELRKINE